MLKLAELVPILVAPFFHWYVNGPDPEATTAKLNVPLGQSVVDATGCVVMPVIVFTVRLALAEVTDPYAPVTITVYVPASPAATDAILKLAEFVPTLVAPFFHWYVNGPVPEATTDKL